jgi:putative transposase/transposase-like zinc-binding protein
MAGIAWPSSRVAWAHPPSLYRPRRPEETVLHRTVREHLETFLQCARDEERPVPRFVEREFRAFLRCGILAHGFLRIHCDDCGCDRLVPFSCKGRGICPSCGGRRMADTAVRLVDSILPRVPVRQWVLTLPFRLRYRLAFDADLTQAVLSIFVRAIFVSLRRRARKRRPLPTPQCGAVTFIQRFGDALNLNVHFHTLALDGVFEGDPRFRAKFRPLPPPETGDVEQVARRVARGVRRLLMRRGLGPDADPSLADPLPEEEPLLAALYGASVHSRIATGRRAGQRVLRFGDGREEENDAPRPSPRSVTVEGLSVHAEVSVPARDRRRLQRLCRYMGRPPVATQRLSRLAEGRLLYRLKRRWRDGTSHILFEPQELLEKLAALVPPPRFHQVRYHGILGPAARERGFVVPTPSNLLPDGVTPPPPIRNEGTRSPLPPAADGHSVPGIAASRHTSTAPPDIPGSLAGPPRPAGDEERDPDSQSRPSATAGKVPLPWAELLRRVFALDVLECPRCGGRMRILTAIQTADAIREILEHLGLPSRAPPILPTSPNRPSVDFGPDSLPEESGE